GAGGSPPPGCSFCRPPMVAASGMPVWQVSESRADYQLFDTPLKFTSAKGPPISLDLVYQTLQPTDLLYYPDNDVNPMFGPQWHCLWTSDLLIDDEPFAETIYWNYLGGRIVYPFSGFTGDPPVSAPAYQNGTRVEIVESNGLAIGG